ncbi:MFS general substrate transporter [Tothia fuscella]|uniref:MFS general substrate transporter n=1 Tax=Tothia fuscella TaxID=1048955 RepID=A0A9P4U5G5_9PEZI|nr:MFS general substrate transporter [Tothia fuscella]
MHGPIHVAFILFSGRLGDLYGYKRLLLLGFSWFALWSAIAGLAVYCKRDVLFIFARVFQGIGPAVILPNGLAILGVMYRPGKRKAMVFSIFGACAPNGSIAGSLFGALFAQKVWWPWAFWSFALVLAATVVVGLFAIPDPPRKVAAVKRKGMRNTLDELDLLGAACGITALILFNFAWNQAPIVGWDKPYVYICLILGIAFIPIFFYVELRVANNPIIPFHAFSRDVSFVLACIACGWATFGIWVYYAWQFYENLRLATPLLATAWLSPVAISGAIASIATGWLLGHLRPAWVMLFALTAFTIGIILQMTMPIHQIYWTQAFIGTVIIPWGMDMSFPAATLILSNAVRKEHQGVAASLVNTIVNYSISLGLGFAGTVEVHVNNGGTTREDILKGYRGAMYVGAALSVLGLLISLSFLLKGILGARRDRR